MRGPQGNALLGGLTVDFGALLHHHSTFFGRGQKKLKIDNASFHAILSREGNPRFLMPI